MQRLPMSAWLLFALLTLSAPALWAGVADELYWNPQGSSMDAAVPGNWSLDVVGSMPATTLAATNPLRFDGIGNNAQRDCVLSSDMVCAGLKSLSGNSAYFGVIRGIGFTLTVTGDINLPTGQLELTTPLTCSGALIAVGTVPVADVTLRPTRVGGFVDLSLAGQAGTSAIAWIVQFNGANTPRFNGNSYLERLELAGSTAYSVLGAGRSLTHLAGDAAIARNSDADVDIACTLRLTANAAITNAGSTGVLTFSGFIDQQTGPYTMAISGGGNTRFAASATGSWTGDTTMGAGTLVVDGNLGATALVVNAPDVVVAGSGTIGRFQYGSAGSGVLRPGGVAVGTLIVNPGIANLSGPSATQLSQVEIQVTGGTPTFDKLSAPANITWSSGSSRLVVDLAGLITTGTIVVSNVLETIGGFTGAVAPGDLVVRNGAGYRVDATTAFGGVSLTITATAVPTGNIVAVAAPPLELSSDRRTVYTAVCPSTIEGLANLRARLSRRDATEARAFSFDSATQAFVEFPLEPGAGLAPTDGLFIATRVGLGLDFSGQSVATPFALSLVPGWNFLGVPPLDDQGVIVRSHAWTDLVLEDAGGNPVAGRSTLIGDGAYAWTVDHYRVVTTLVTGRGYWVKNNSASQTFYLSRKPTFTPEFLSSLNATATAAAAPAVGADRGTPPPPPASATGGAAGGGCGGGSAMGIIILAMAMAFALRGTATRG